MKHRFSPIHVAGLALLATILPDFTVHATASPNGGGGPSLCEKVARRQRKAKRLEALSDLWREFGICLNMTDPGERAECMADAFEELWIELAEIRSTHDARNDLCFRLGGGAYDTHIDPADFSSIITNPYLPYPVGTTWTYEKVEDGETETVVVTVLDETREIEGVDCRAVRDTVTVDGELVEDTVDYFAQDNLGNVWYFGEISMNFEDGVLVDIDGSWIAGEEGAQAGIVMKASPCPGDVYRQEFAPGEAEDAGAVEALDAFVMVPFGAFSGALKTSDFTPLEPDALEFKYYAIGVGLVLEVDPETGERLELLSMTP